MAIIGNVPYFQTNPYCKKCPAWFFFVGSIGPLCSWLLIPEVTWGWLKWWSFRKMTGNSMIGHILRDSSSKPPPGEICEETNRCLWVHRRCLDQLDVKGWVGSDGHSLQCFSQVWPSPLQMCRWPSRQEFRPHSEWRIEKQKTTEDRGWSSCPSTLR